MLVLGKGFLVLSKFPSCSSGSLFIIEDKNDCIC